MVSGVSRRLSNGGIRDIKGTAAVPAYDRTTVTPGIVHLGVGAFHRAHQAVYVDDCLEAGASGWGIVGASLRSSDTRDALALQDGLYTLAVQDASGEKLRVIGSLLELLVAPENPEALVVRMTSAATRIVTLTVTEKAYLRNAEGGLDLEHPDVVWDLANPATPKTVYGFLATALDRRFAAGTPAFTVLCCDNLPANGATVKRLFHAFVEAREGAVSDKMAAVAFPSTMVDRIVPATTDEDRERISQKVGLEDAWPVKAEPFLQWVVEDDFPLGRPDWEPFGVQMVADVAPFEDMKLRLLNGAHSAIAYLGLLAGHATVSEAFGDPDIRHFVKGLWCEAIPSLPGDANLNPDTYTAALTERFDNPALVHRTAQIAMDGSQKLPQRILASAASALREGRSAAHLLLVPAAWIACCASRGNALPKGHFTDPLDERLPEILGQDQSSVETVRAVFKAAGFGAIDRDGAMAEVVGRHLDAIRQQGAKAAMQAVFETRDGA